MMFHELAEHGFNGGKLTRSIWGNSYIQRYLPDGSPEDTIPVFHKMTENDPPELWTASVEELTSDDWSVVE